MKILYAGAIPIQYGGLQDGGVAIYCWKLAFKAKQEGHNVIILGNTKNIGIGEGIQIYGYLLNKNIKILFFRFFCTLFLIIKNIRNKHLNFLSFLEKIKLHFLASAFLLVYKQTKPDIIHLHSLSSFMSLACTLVSVNTPVIVTHHGIGVALQNITSEQDWPYEIPREKIKKIVKIVATKAKIIISPSRIALSSLTNTIGVAPEKQKLIYHPLSFDSLSEKILNTKKQLYQELGISPNKKILLFIALNHPLKIKGLDILIDTFKDYSSLKDLYHIVAIVDQNAYNILLKKKLSFLTLFPPLNHESLKKYYINADLFVMPSKHEGMSLVYLEALFFGLPIIGYKPLVEELNEVLKMTVGYGFDYHSETTKDLKNKIEAGLNLKLDITTIGHKLIQLFNWDNHFQQIEEIYKNLEGRDN